MLKTSVLSPPIRNWHLPVVAEERAPAEGLYLTEETYWQEYYAISDRSYEWNNGFLEAKPSTTYTKYLIYAWLVDLLKDFLHVNPLARMIGLDMGFRLALPRKVTVRKPDLGVVLHSNPIPLRDDDRSYRGIFDLCIESLSDSSQAEVDRDTIIKKLEYAQAGVREYYILDDQKTETAFYVRNAKGVYQPITPQKGVIHSTILPGFQFRISDLYFQPRPPDMITDPVYRSFVSPDYRAERERAEQAEAELRNKNQELEEQAQELKRQAQAMKQQAQELARKEAEIAELKAKLQQQGIE